ncbi:MAG: hypothetical protein K9N11_03790 [Lentisphaeria bacterium]|nr:hypothetical protein [Candidatus Neomarinimicrobiota bacterium]MCF7841953.1 hypothetical protein [Lentisphaeria bacterium]
MQTWKMVCRHTVLLLGLVFFTNCATTTLQSDNTLGRLVVGFDIDDTILYSEDNFLAVPPNPADPAHLDYAWINSHDSVYSKVITDMAKVVHFFRAQGHAVYFITARPGVNGDYLARFLTRELEFPVVVNDNLFFSPKERDPETGIRHTVKHRLIRKLGIHLFYGDSDTDIVAALVGGAHPVRVVRDPKSLHAYSRNHFGDIISEPSAGNPFTVEDYKKFILTGVGPYGETIFPIYDFERPLPGFESD